MYALVYTCFTVCNIRGKIAHLRSRKPWRKPRRKRGSETKAPCALTHTQALARILSAKFQTKLTDYTCRKRRRRRRRLYYTYLSFSAIRRLAFPRAFLSHYFLFFFLYIFYTHFCCRCRLPVDAQVCAFIFFVLFRFGLV